MQNILKPGRGKLIGLIAAGASLSLGAYYMSQKHVEKDKSFKLVDKDAKKFPPGEEKPKPALGNDLPKPPEKPEPAQGNDLPKPPEKKTES